MIREKKHFKHIQYSDRIKIETLLKEKNSISDIAKKIGFSESTIYREIKRGEYQRYDT